MRRRHSIISALHTREHSRRDGWVCQSAGRTAARSSAVPSSPTTVWLTLRAPQPLERISLHLHGKRCRGFHFSISLCTYIHLLIKPSMPQISHANTHSKCVDTDGKEFQRWHWCYLQAWCLLICPQEEGKTTKYQGRRGKKNNENDNYANQQTAPR